MTGTVKQSKITAGAVAAGDINYNNISPLINPGLAALVAQCLKEIDDKSVALTFFADLQYFTKRTDIRNLKTKLHDAGASPLFYEGAIESKEWFAKFFEVIARHPTGQRILVAAFRHAYSVYKEQIAPVRDEITFADQQAAFEEKVVTYLSYNLSSLPGFYGRDEALGLIYYLADRCFIDYAHV